nr:hypothetical protein [Tanacetum cinerariifolium]
MAFLSSPGSTNEVDTANIQVSTISTPVSIVSSHDNTANLSNGTVYAFLADQPNRSQLVHEDLEKIHEDDLEEIDLKWQLALLSMRARRYFQRTGNKEVLGTKKAGQGIKTVNVEDTSSKAIGHLMEQVLIRATWLMMKFQPTWLLWLSQTQRIEFNKSEFDLATYKRGLASVEEELLFYKKSEIKIDNFKNASKSLDKLIGSQVTDNNITGLGFTSYNAVAPPPTGLFVPPTINLSNSGLEEFQQPEFKGYEPKDSKNGTKTCVENVEKKTVQREVRPVWNNAMWTNHQNFSNSRRNFAPTVVLTKSGIVPISTAKHSSSKAASPVSATRPINIVASKPLVNIAKPRQNDLQTSHSLSGRPFYQQTALKNRNSNNNVNTAKANSVNTTKGNKVVSVVRKQGINVVKLLASKY